MTGLLRYYPNRAAYQIWEGLGGNFSVHKDYELDIRQTDHRHEFVIAVSDSWGSKTCRKKTFSTIGRKKNFGDGSNINRSIT